MDPVTITPLRDRLGLASWGVLCVTGMYVCLYYTAYKHLRIWLAVREVLKNRQDDPPESARAPFSATTASVQTVPWSRYIPHMIKASATAPIIAWAWRTYSLGAGYLDIIVIAICYICLVVAICCVMNLSSTDLAVTSQAVTKQQPKGWAVVPTTSAPLIAVAQTNFLAFPITSILMCTWLLTRDSPAWKPLGDAMLIVMLCLAPIVGIRTIRATDIRMRHVFWIGLAGIGIIIVTVVTLFIIQIASGPDVTPPPTGETTEDGFIVWVLSRAATKAFYDLCVLFRTGQIAALLYYPVFAILRFEYDQVIRTSDAEYTAIGQVDEMLDSGDQDPLAPDVEKVTTMIPSSTTASNASDVALIPITLSTFPAKLFRTALVGGYLGSLLSIILFPQPDIWDICTLGAFMGILVALGGRLIIEGHAQRKALWVYEEVWTATPLKQEAVV